VRHPLLFGLLVALPFLLHRLSVAVADPDRDREVRLAFLDALVHAGITHKQAYLQIGYSAGHWSEMCSGVEALPSLTRLARLPWRFWSEFLPRLAWVLCAQHVNEVAESLSLKRRA